MRDRQSYSQRRDVPQKRNERETPTRCRREPLFRTLKPDRQFGYLTAAYHMPAATDGLRYDGPHSATSGMLVPMSVSQRHQGSPAVLERDV